MRAILCLALVGAISLSGCSRLARKARADPVSIVSVPKVSDTCPYIQGIGDGDALAINLDCYRFPGEQATAYSMAVEDKGARNRLEAALLQHADSVCELMKGKYFANEATIGLTYDFLASSFSIASTIVGGEQAKTILSGLASLSTASKSHVQADVYKNQIVPAITNVIDSERQRLLNDLIAKRSMAIDIYSVDEMIRLVNSYHQACSFQHGVQLLLKASINKAGSDAILQSINLQFALTKLKAELADYRQRSPAPDQAKIDDYEAKISELAFKLVATSDGALGDSNVSVTPESKGTAVQNPTPVAPKANK